MHFNTLTHVMSDCVNRVSTTNLVSIDLRLLTLDTELELLLKKQFILCVSLLFWSIVMLCVLCSSSSTTYSYLLPSSSCQSVDKNSS